MKSDSEDKELETGTGEFVNADDAAEKEEQLPDEIGDVKVADEVISIVAGLAAQEVNGVIGMSGSFAEGLNEFLGKKSFAKGVRITVDGHVVTAAVYVNVEYGSCIPEIALEIQEKVKEAIENMTVMKSNSSMCIYRAWRADPRANWKRAWKKWTPPMKISLVRSELFWEYLIE